MLPPASKEVLEEINKRSAEAWSWHQTKAEVISFSRFVVWGISQFPSAAVWTVKFAIKVTIGLVLFAVSAFLLLTIIRLAWKLILFAWT